MADDGDVDRRLAELEEVLDREAAAARRAVEAPALEDAEEGALARREEAAPVPARRLGGVVLRLAGLGLVAVVAVKVVVPLLLLPVVGALALAWAVLRFAVLGAAVYGAWTLLGRGGSGEGSPPE